MDMVIFEKDKVKGVICIDFILLVEIVVILLGIVVVVIFLIKVMVLFVIVILMIVGVYGFVVMIVKIDDLGLYLI